MKQTQSCTCMLQVKETNRQLQLCEKQLARKREEAQEYEAQYRLAESKRLEADSYINELTLVAIGMEPDWEAGSAESKEILMKKYHLLKEQNDVRPVVYCKKFGEV